MLMARLLILTIVFAAGIAVVASNSASRSGLLLVANKGEHTLGIIDPATAQQIATVAETGVTGHEVVASPDGKLAFVPIYGDSGVGLPGSDGRTLDVVELAQRRVIHTIDFGHGVRPHCPVFGPKDGLLYVTTELDNAITIIDPHTFKIIGNIPTAQPESHMLAISPDGKSGYTANVGPGTVSVLDLKARKNIAVISVAHHVQRISISPDGRWVLTSDTEKPRLAVIDTRSNQVARWVELPGSGYGSAFNRAGTLLLIAIPEKNVVAVVDIAKMQVAKTIEVPPAPQELVVAPNDDAFVSCDRSGKIAQISANSNLKLIDAGRVADGLAWVQ